MKNALRTVCAFCAVFLFSGAAESFESEKEQMLRIWLRSYHPHRSSDDQELNGNNLGVGWRKYFPREKGSWFGERRFVELDFIPWNSYKGKLVGGVAGIEDRVAVIGGFNLFASVGLAIAHYEDRVNDEKSTQGGPVPALSASHRNWENWRVDITFVPKNGHRLKVTAFSVSYHY